MTIFALVFSLFLVGLGALIGRYPTVISGYNTMSDEKRKNIDLQAIGQLMKRGFGWIGAATAGGYLICYALGWRMLAGLMIVIPLLTGLIILIVLAQKYDRNKRSWFARWFPAAFIVAVSIFVGSMLSSDAKPTKVVVTPESVEFTGQYGVTIPFGEIEQVELLNAIPEIEMRTNGFALGEVRKGFFRLSEWGKCRLLLESDTPPYLLIRLKSGDRIIYNTTDPANTKQLAEGLAAYGIQP